MRFLIATCTPAIGVYAVTQDPLLTVAAAIVAWMTAAIIAIGELL